MRDPTLTCPHCGSDYVVRSHRRAIERPFLYLLHSIPYRCGSCESRFYRRQKGNNSSVSSVSAARPPRVPPSHREETFSLTPPAHAEVPLGRRVSDASVRVPGPTGVQAAGRSAASVGIPREEAATWRGRRPKEPQVSHGWHKRHSPLGRYWRDVSYSLRRNRLGPYFKRYWGDVSHSFRCDLRTFYSDCRRFLAS